MLDLLPSALLLAALPPQERLLLRLVPFAAGLLVITAFFCYATRAGVIARATTKEAIRQPLFPLLMALALLVLVTNTFVPFFSFGEDYRMLIDCGLATILICGLLLAVWTSSTSIADEIEGKTAMTLLSKPINRRQFVLGKFVGIMVAVFWLILPLMICFLALVYYKVGYDSRESANPDPESAFKLTIMLNTIPGLILSFFEICVLTSVSVAISTRVPMVVNMVTCFAIFVVGHVTSVIVERGVLHLEVVQFTARLLATALPNLELFKTEAASTGTFVPPPYLGYAGLYCAAFSIAAIFLAFILFEDRDLA
ncbi:MAG TPA: ABC transporter permease subunit [Planctomycetaceae bacterium]|jgi:ABC-type transport system involved in multi-copper enzyme maturation permease subunit|nr:ABC transporter permease subunit [Planctomycetaceae bacterium]